MAAERQAATPALRDLARRLVESEAAGQPSAPVTADGAERAVSKLREYLARLIGIGGFRALLARALQLTKAEVPSLRGVQAEPDGALSGLPEWVLGRDPAEARAALVAVLANVLWLLAVFIGDDLVERLVREVWPQVRLPANGSGFEETTE